MGSELLTVGMATYGEFDSVWFTLTGLSANHPKVRYLVVDNTPERCVRTEAITKAVGGTYVHRPDLSGTSKPRDAVFRFAETEWAMCIDSHVLLESGAVAAALDYCKSHPESKDLIQGPMVYDDGKGYSTHWNQPAPPGLWGTWDQDRRAQSPEPFEIPMMGLGLWMMRRSEWVGFNPLFRGFGGEEGYTHEVVRRRGGKCLCLPALRWRHKFRDVSGWDKNPHPPYPLRLEDHVWNLLVGHRELGINAEQQIYDHFGKKLSKGTWAKLVEQSRTAQPSGGPRLETKRQRILALWYSDNSAPAPLTQRSAATVLAAAKQTLRHDVTVSACSWGPVAGFHSEWSQFEGEKRRGYDTIVRQIRQAVAKATANGERYDAVAFCEHDVLYPPNYFDRIGGALAAAANAPVVSNLDYIGLNGTGWQRVRERHEPLHQLTLRWDTFERNLSRAEAEAKSGQPVILEPDHNGDRSKWARIPPSTGEVQMPSAHVNHSAGRWTSHGDVCYEPTGYALFHPHWGEAKGWWVGPMTTVAVTKAEFKQPAAGCSACEADKHQTLAQWFDAAKANPSDFNEHVETLRELATHCGSATELSTWQKPADVAIAAGLGEKAAFTSVCRRPKPQWKSLAKHLGGRFRGVEAEPNGFRIDPTDLLFIDTEHQAEVLLPILERNHQQVAKYVVIHCTEIYGTAGDAPETLGVMHALRTFCMRNPEWVVKRRDRNNYGLIVLSKCAEDVKELPSLWRKAMNYTQAIAKHVAAGRPVVSLEVLEQRQGECAVCPERALDACAACGCPLENKLPWATETCGLEKKGLSPKWGPVTDPSQLRQ